MTTRVWIPWWLLSVAIPIWIVVVLLRVFAALLHGMSRPRRASRPGETSYGPRGGRLSGREPVHARPARTCP
jgi:hypothetical protein